MSEPFNIDEDIRDADWAKRSFDLPDVQTADDYRKAFGLRTPEDVSAHIAERTGSPFWDGVPAKIKAGLMKYRLGR